MDIKQLMTGEAGVINTMFQRNNLRAKVDRRHSVCVETGYLSYALTLAMDERFAKVEAMQRELSTVLGNARRRHSLPGDVQVIPVSFPRMALELPHPQPAPLLATNAALTSAAPHSLLAGRSYIEGPQDEYIVFDDTPHVLVAGITGAGKSVLLQTMLLSLAASTSPAECKLVLIDLKNEDLVPFERLPHTLTFAGTKAAALDALRFVQAEKDKRVANRGYKPYRVVLVIDEMAQLAGNSEAREILGDLASIGRAKDVNLIGATQHPTKEGGLGALLKANFGVRLVGQVAPGQSQYATNRPGTHADLLPGRGAFLRCQGPHVYRIQSYFVDEKDKGEVSNMVRSISRLWGSTTTAKHVASTRVVEAVEGSSRSLVEGPVVEAVEGNRRDEIADIAEQIRDMVADNASKNAMCKAVFGRPYAGSYAAKIDAAIARLSALPTGDDNKIIKLRRTGTGGD